jgi:signal transduction histidine kinase/ActR/RegA family two-component response regulator
MFPRSLSLRLQLLIMFAAVAGGSAAVLGVFGYQSAIGDLERNARRSVAAAAQSREETLTRMLQFRQDRAAGFLTSVESSCGEVGARSIAWELGCVRTALREFRFTERADAALLLYRGRRIARSGTWTPVDPPTPEMVARIVTDANGSVAYVMHAQSGELSVTLRFSNDELIEIFRSNYGLGSSGEVFLIDGEGRLLTSLRYVAPEADERRSAAAEAYLTGGCLAGRSEEVIAPDYRGVKTIHGLRSTMLFGGVGCIDAHQMYDEALAPTVQMRQQLLYRGLGFFAGAILLSLLASSWIARPIRRLVSSARAMQSGRFDAAIRVGGPSEVRTLGRAFAAMGRALSDLLTREQTARQQAEAANRAKDDFIAVVSHELRTPLTAILGWTHLLNSGKLDAAQAARALQTIERSAETQSRLIDDLLDVSSIASATLRLHRRPVSMPSAIEAAIEAIRPNADRKKIDLRAAIDRDAGLISADPERLQQIVGNLLSNAVKFTPEGGRVYVALEQHDDIVQLTVRDNGIGITADFLPHVFGRFRQASGATTREHGGLGLGLAIVKHLVEMHGGTVYADSAGPGQGAAFVVSLPKIGTGEAAITGMRPFDGEQAQRLADVNVLVVDDDAPTRDVVRAVLAAAGARVTTAASAAEARDVVTRVRPAIVVSDLAMPGEDGFALMKSLRENGTTAEQVPAIALSALARREDVDAAMAAGFQAHVAKPVDVGELVNTIAQLARKRAA